MFFFKVNGKPIDNMKNDDRDDFMGSHWKFAKDQTKKPSTPVAPTKGEDGGKTPASNPDAPPAGETTGDADNKPSENDAPVKYTQGQLKSMNKAEIQEIACTLGVANLEETKDKLIEAILEKQA